MDWGFLSPRRVALAARYAWQGVGFAVRERAIKLEFFLTPPIVAAAFFLTGDGVGRALLVFSWLLVPLVELLNTALEKLADRVAGSKNDTLVGQAKDLGAAAVLWALLTAAAVWLCVLWPGG